MTTIAKRFTFDAAHRLGFLPPDHKCHRMHGHSYEVEVVLCGPVDPATGMIVDYADIASAWQVVHDKIDHRVLNEVAGLEIPTTEVLAAWILRTLARHLLQPNKLDYVGQVGVRTLVDRVRVKESTTTWCEVTTAEVFCDEQDKVRSWSNGHPTMAGR